MSNLRALANSLTKAINPNQIAYLELSNGFAQDQSYKQVAVFLDPAVVEAQVQELSSRELRQVEGLNLQGNEVAIYLNGRADAIVRVTQKGGDLITIPEGVNAGVYLTVKVLEQWQGDWVKIACSLQNQDVAEHISSLDFSDIANSGNLPGVLG